MPKPFLRWAGGKYNLIGTIKNHLPPNITQCRYIEPFLGAGALFFFLEPKNSILADLNEHLIHCYIQIKIYPTEVYDILKGLAEHNTEDMYYKIREEYNSMQHSPEQAARFIYLNKTSFNGIFRVNKKGKYNVPYGFKKTISIPNKMAFLHYSRILKNAELKQASFELITSVVSQI